MTRIDEVPEDRPTVPANEELAQSPELQLLCAALNLLVYNLEIILVDALNVLFGIYGANPGWTLASTSQSFPPRPSPIGAGTVTAHDRPANRPSVRAQSEVHYDPRTFDQSVGASYNASGSGASITLHTGGQVYMGAQKPAPGSLAELESHFKRIDLSTFTRQISIQLTKNGGTYHVGTIEGCSVMKTMHFYRRGSDTDSKEDPEWERRLLWGLKCLGDVGLSRISAQIYGICRTSFVTAVIYNGALVPLYLDRFLQVSASWSQFRFVSLGINFVISKKDVHAHNGLKEIVLANPKFQKEVMLSTWAKDHLRLQHWDLHKYWKQHGFDYPHSLFVRLDTGQMVVADSAVEEINGMVAGVTPFGRPVKLDTYFTPRWVVPAEIPLAWQEECYVWDFKNKEDQIAAEHWVEAARQHHPTLDNVIKDNLFRF